WRWLFLAGLVVGCALVRAAGWAPALEISASTPEVVAAGLLVGFGTRLGNGCTSGHGVCGIARLSRRSLVATATFMAAGAATVFVMRHVIGG
ncbi:MAG: YeeE/YedE family protein, partial [Candidatus Binatia bacterium]